MSDSQQLVGFVLDGGGSGLSWWSHRVIR
jgi:hypothetical protein